MKRKREVFEKKVLWEVRKPDSVLPDQISKRLARVFAIIYLGPRTSRHGTAPSPEQISEEICAG